MKKGIQAATPEAYLAGLPEPRQQMLRTLDAAIRNAAPDLDPHIRSGFLGYGTYHYKYASGREGDWCIVGLASNKQYISLYLCAADERGYLAEQNQHRLGKVSVGRSCIRFKKLQDLNLDVALELIREGAARVRKSGQFGL